MRTINVHKSKHAEAGLLDTISFLQKSHESYYAELLMEVEGGPGETEVVQDFGVPLAPGIGSEEVEAVDADKGVWERRWL